MVIEGWDELSADEQEMLIEEEEAKAADTLAAEELAAVASLPAHKDSLYW